VLDQLVAELAAAGHWDAEVTREVLVELAKRGRDRGEIARVLRAVAAGAHGQTGSPRRMLAWWPGETPAAAGVPVESYRHQAAPRDAGRCYRHPDQPADCPLDDHPVLAGEITDAAAAAIAAARAKLPRGKPLSRRERPRATPPSTTPGEAVVSDVGAESDPESAAA
jgi:hypothetical protein